MCTIGNNERPILPPLPADPPNKDALRILFSTAFATGLDNFLEIRWYSQHGFEALLSDRELLAQFLAYVTFTQNRQTDSNHNALASQELRVVWGLMQLVRRGDLEGAGIDAPQNVTSVLQAFEALLTGIPPGNNILHHVQFCGAPSSVLQQQLTRRKQEFWTAFGNFVVLLHKDEFGSSTLADCEQELETCRSRLDALENRDIIYSIMTMHYLGRHDELGIEPRRSSTSQSSALTDPLVEAQHFTGGNLGKDCKTAYNFLQKEAGGRATNIVYGSIASMALRAWID